MTVSNTADKVQVSVTNRHEMDVQLQRNVALLVERACLYRNRGILITRHSQTDFTLELNDVVPFGETIEIDRR